MLNDLFKNLNLALVIPCGFIYSSVAKPMDFQVELKPLPFLYNFQEGWSGYGGDVGIRLNNKFWFTSFIERSNSNFEVDKQSANGVIFTGHDLNLMIAKIRYFYEENDSGYYASAGVLNYDITLKYYDGNDFNKTIKAFLPNVGFGFQHKFSSGISLRIEAEVSIFLSKKDERNNLPATENNPIGSKTLLDTLKSPVLPGLDIAFGYIF